MPYQLDTPVLTVDRGIIHKVDAGNPQNLFSMWTVFSKCADSVQNGRRLEYMCWRYWNRATIRGEYPEAALVPTSMQNAKDIITATSLPDLPQLSKSVDSAMDEDAVDFSADLSPLDIRPRILRQDSCASNSRRSPRSDDFEKLFVSILKEGEVPALLTPPAAAQQPAVAPELERSGSTTTESSTTSEDVTEESQPSPDTPFHTTTVIRGFSPVEETVIAQPVSVPSSVEKPMSARVQRQTAFTLGPSPSSSSDQQSLPRKTSLVTRSRQAPRFELSTPSEGESSLRETVHQSRSVTFLSRKQQAAQPQEPSRAMMSGSAVSDYSETGTCTDVDESAIDDDEDDSDWEDSDEVSGKSSIDDKTYFKRVDSSANLVSRRSLLTLGLAATERQRGLGNITSQSTSALHRARGAPGVPQPAVGPASPNDSDEAPLMMKGTRAAQLKPIREAPRTAAQPIMAQGANGHYQAALSPRTTRRHMLATELTESLRRHLLWERQQKSSTANAVLKRRHTSHDVANLKQYPEKAYMDKSEDANASSWNQYFAKEAFNGYHSKGW
ncbi:uncharacterized protein DNG_07656 [Cephalotrichum gorgonifer]|uniref:Nitrogen regulatory protein areA GATA-like domain-containing protein n=1 Tax=Cephalotrichum gorgonifer TaxID=2041049 RepID=A0AAE8N221_9PEZI|nr:uncharacterized protein DNG_07656 [Cephalotrichum gorgonifer]